MTKPRAPLTLDAALARIAGQFPAGYDDLGQIVGKAPSVVRRWGDPDQPLQLPMSAAIALDIAFAKAGGEGAPIFETYALLLQVAEEEAFADQIQLARSACDLVRESAQAVEAIIVASMPDATQAQRDRAAAELEDVDQLIPRAIAQLKGSVRMPPDTG